MGERKRDISWRRFFLFAAALWGTALVFGWAVYCWHNRFHVLDWLFDPLGALLSLGSLFFAPFAAWGLGYAFWVMVRYATRSKTRVSYFAVGSAYILASVSFLSVLLYDNSLRSSGVPVLKFAGEIQLNQSFNEMTWSGGSTEIAVLTSRSMLSIVDIVSRKVQNVPTQMQGILGTASWTDDDSTIAVSQDRTVRLFTRSQSGFAKTHEITLPAGFKEVTVTWSADGRLFYGLLTTYRRHIDNRLNPI